MISFNFLVSLCLILITNIVINGFKRINQVQHHRKLFNSNQQSYGEINSSTSQITTNIDTLINSGLEQTPGFVSSKPISTNAQSRKEIAKLVVGGAILWLTLNIKIKDIMEKLNASVNSNDKQNVRQSRVVMSNGIEYIDSVTTNNEQQTFPINLNDEFIVNAKLFYNGL